MKVKPTDVVDHGPTEYIFIFFKNLTTLIKLPTFLHCCNIYYCNYFQLLWNNNGSSWYICILSITLIRIVLYIKKCSKHICEENASLHIAKMCIQNGMPII